MYKKDSLHISWYYDLLNKNIKTFIHSSDYKYSDIANLRIEGEDNNNYIIALTSLKPGRQDFNFSYGKLLILQLPTAEI